MNKPRHKLFVRTWGLSYMPVTLEGAGCSLLFTLVWMIPLGGLIYLSENDGSWFLRFICIALLIIIGIAFLRFARRHS